eukprot:TRINITY_DN34313_c0_g2_i1.p1 TRINITY_DN34313_c0_g2~~TRINITY_DN34313_c0_g2_i1.p1  ORF type:complete len:111 (-),score=19.82 TRINITY_DN34313_c0_g2_i1:98-430(-)
MGSSVSCDCDAETDNTLIVAQAPAADSDVVDVQLSKAGAKAVKKEAKEVPRRPPIESPSDLHKLLGHWRNEEDGSIMGLIKEGNVIWEPVFNHPPSKLTVINGGEWLVIF